MALVKIFRGFLEREREHKTTCDRRDVDEEILPGMNGSVRGMNVEHRR
jgi:hypothetical protein